MRSVLTDFQKDDKKDAVHLQNLSKTTIKLSCTKAKALIDIGHKNIYLRSLQTTYNQHSWEGNRAWVGANNLLCYYNKSTEQSKLNF